MKSFLTPGPSSARQRSMRQLVRHRPTWWQTIACQLMKLVTALVLPAVLTSGAVAAQDPAEIPSQDPAEIPSLKEAFAGKFLIGTALNTRQITGQDTAAMRIVNRHFNAIVAENCMKSRALQPREGQFDFGLADRFVALGERSGHHITGHTLIWHSQAPPWFFIDDEGREVTRDVLIGRMEQHIKAVVGRYRGRVAGWDVVNEAILDDGSWRRSRFYEIIGEEYIALAFRFAHEADPDAELYYNDYSMASPGKRRRVVQMVRQLREQGIRVDGIGMQGHVGLRYPLLDEFEKSLEAFSELGLKVMITEFDLTVLPSPGNNRGAEISDRSDYRQNLDPYRNGLPDSIEEAFNNRCLDFFRLFLKHHDKISRVTLWGISDRSSWRNNWPIRGRTDYPLLFDRRYRPKAVVRWIVEAAGIDR